MTKGFTIMALVMLGLLHGPVAQAAPSTSVQIEISFLLGFIDGSRCDFLRNGNWYSAQAAQVHVRDKYKALLARNQVDTSEQFIERAAAQSSLSAKPYAIRCGGGATVPTQQWLLEELARYRTFP